MTRPLYTAYLCLLLSLCSGFVYSQQGNNWYFGLKAGLTFNTNPPSLLMDSKMNTDEGCASMSDLNGQLLFYTDGSTVYNKLHQEMPNGTGLLGHPSSANSAIIIPKPGSNTIFYIFTADAAERKLVNGYNYSEVDLSLNGGSGDVTQKNIRLYAPCSERLTAVRHANGVDIWVVTRAVTDNSWAIYLVDCNGVNTTPVITKAGILGSSVGCLKGSPDGKKIATTHTGTYDWEIFDFDNSTGKLSNVITMDIDFPFGVEFSPDSRFLYVSAEAEGKIIQYDITVHDAAAINASWVQVGENRTNQAGLYPYIGGLQLGPDNKIYCTLDYSYYISVIHEPNKKGLACNYVHKEIHLADRQIRRSLPVFFPSLITNQNADFNFTNSATCGVIDFSGISRIPGTVTYDWDFGDGNTATGQNVTHSYASGGGNLYKVKLTITNTSVCGGSGTIMRQIDLNPAAPVARFGITDSCGKLQVSFHDSSRVNAGNPISNWEWDFGDGNTSSGKNPDHTYTGYGSYNVTLKVTGNGCNNSSTIQKTLLLKPKPLAAFINTKACVNKNIEFTDESWVNPNRAITKWYWNFGDGNTSLHPNPKKAYTNPGTFEVKLAVVSDEGCGSDTLKRLINVNGIPTAGFKADNACVNYPITFTDDSRIASGTIAKWYWDFGNGQSSVVQEPVNTFTAPGSYTIKQVVESTNGCISDTASSLITIDSRPAPAMQITDGCQNQRLEFFDRSSNTTGKIEKWFWDYGNGTNSILQNPNPVYASGGSYTVKMAVGTGHGCVSDTVQQTIIIESIPTVDYSYDSSCVGKEIKFTNLSTNAFGNITQYQWNFDDGHTSTARDTAYIYNHFGNYKVSLTAVTGNGCRANKTTIITIAPVLVRTGKDITAAIGQPVPLTATGAETYVWQPSTYLNDPFIANPISTPYQSITYFLTGTTAEGCIGHDTIVIKAYKGPEVYVPNAFVPEGKNRVFRAVLAGIQQLSFFTVYNRYGQMVFTTNDPERGWDGTFGGRPQPAGTFVWTLKAVDYMGKVIEKKGTVLLMR